MIKIAKNTGNVIEMREFKNNDDFKKGKWCSYGSRTIKEIDLNKSYISELYCRRICGNYYLFGCDWDRRCNNDDKPINQVVRKCPKFINAMEIAKELQEKMESDDDFMRFCEICNANMNNAKTKYGRSLESALEVFMAIFKSDIE